MTIQAIIPAVKKRWKDGLDRLEIRTAVSCKGWKTCSKGLEKGTHLDERN